MTITVSSFDFIFEFKDLGLLKNEKKVEVGVDATNTGTTSNENENDYRITSLTKINFIICLGIQNFVGFVNQIELKNYSYVINFSFYLYVLFAIVMSNSMSYIMNIKFFGRRRSKLILIVIFLFTNIFLLVVQDLKISLQIYNISKLCIQMCAMIFHTHLNETFTTKDRLEIHSYSFIVGKLTAALAPLVTEYFEKNAFLVLVLFSGVLFAFYWNQEETMDKKLIDK